jgi:hypothetical protein
MKRFLASFLVFLLALSSWNATAVIRAGGTGQSPAAVAITGGTLTGTNVEYIVASWAIPVGVAPSGTMANNGAVTMGTAFTTTYSGGIWLWYPAGAVAAGVPAAATYLWTVMSSTTLGTVYNSTFNGLSVPTMGVQTAYVTTGPGAFTGAVTSQAAIIATIPANAMGASGSVIFEYEVVPNNTAGSKIGKVQFNTSAAAGGTQVSQLSTTTTHMGSSGTIQNRGATNSQVKSITALGQVAATDNVANVYSALDTTAATYVVYSLDHNGVATDNSVIERGSVRVRYGP